MNVISIHIYIWNANKNQKILKNNLYDRFIILLQTFLLNTQLQKSSLLINFENLQLDHPPHLEREMRKKERTNY